MASLAPLKQHFHKLDGTIAAGYYLTFYAAGTTTPQNTYTDQGGGTPNTNPIQLDARGEASIWYDSTLNYKVILSSDALAASVEWTMDVVASIPDTSLFTINRKGADIASASTINLNVATGDYVHITGTTGISVVTLASGKEVSCIFDASLVLTNSANLILPKGSANITTAAGDVAVFRGEGSSVTRCVEYQTKTGYAQLNGDTAQAFSASALTATGAITTSGTGPAGSFVANGASSGVELGNLSANTPYIDFHSSANALDYDSRIVASGGSAALGSGSLNVYASGGVTFDGRITAPNLSPDIQTFAVNGTWTKPTGFNPNDRVIVEIWGAGGGGSGAAGAGSGGGGGGGAYVRKEFNLSTLGATEAVTVGVGGAAGGALTNGAVGGNTSFGAWISAYGGGGGAYNANGGGGGGSRGAGAVAGTGGSGYSATNNPAVTVDGDFDTGGGGGNAGTIGGSSTWGGGGGGSGAVVGNGGYSTYGGGGGAGYVAPTSGAAGLSLLGGSGGVAGVAGTNPAGGGGYGAAGGNGYCVVTVLI